MKTCRQTLCFYFFFSFSPTIPIDTNSTPLKDRQCIPCKNFSVRYRGEGHCVGQGSLLTQDEQRGG